jgi:hypothetical protein
MERRLRRLQMIWPRRPCPECADLPAVVGVPDGEEEPEFPAKCPGCGRILPPVVLVIGVAKDAI